MKLTQSGYCESGDNVDYKDIDIENTQVVLNHTG